jgi:hypothetical protein
VLIALSCDTKWGISEREISACFKDDIKKDLEQLGVSTEHFNSLPDSIQLRITTVYRSGRLTLSISAQQFIQAFVLGHGLSWQVLDYLEDYEFSFGESEYLLLGDLSSSLCELYGDALQDLIVEHGERETVSVEIAGDLSVLSCESQDIGEPTLPSLFIVENGQSRFSTTYFCPPVRFSPCFAVSELLGDVAFAMHHDHHYIVAWGENAKLSQDVERMLGTSNKRSKNICANYFSIAVLHSDGSVSTYGDYGSGINSGSCSANVSSDLSNNVEKLVSTSTSFAALKTDGSVVTWGYPKSGGDSRKVSSHLMSGVIQIFSTGAAFAALKNDGSVVTWGDPKSGGDSRKVSSHLMSGVIQIFSTGAAFAALKNDGSVVTWGDPKSGGDSSKVSSDLKSGVKQIFSSLRAFAALKDDESVIIWGDSTAGGSSKDVNLRGQVSQIVSTAVAFAALKNGGSVVVWGHPEHGGDSSAVASELDSGVLSICSTGGAFAALKKYGSVVTWGDALRGGDSREVASFLQSGVQRIFSTQTAFAALMDSGAIITWGGSSDAIYLGSETR